MGAGLGRHERGINRQSQPMENDPTEESGVCREVGLDFESPIQADTG
jgi:hypothetical protein